MGFKVADAPELNRVSVITCSLAQLDGTAFFSFAFAANVTLRRLERVCEKKNLAAQIAVSFMPSRQIKVSLLLNGIQGWIRFSALI